MAEYWSAENATNAYLQALEMGNSGTKDQPDVLEFISSIAASNNSKLMVIVCGGHHTQTQYDDDNKHNKLVRLINTTSPIIALATAAQHTGGQVICIFPATGDEDQQQQQQQLIASLNSETSNSIAGQIKFIVGDAHRLIPDYYREADFVLIDCSLEKGQLMQAIMHHDRINKIKGRRSIVLGYNLEKGKMARRIKDPAVAYRRRSTDCSTSSTSSPDNHE